VVGPPGAPIHTDRDHRIKVQFHWQRGAQSHSRLEHPSPDGHIGAPSDDQAGTWVRVATPMAPVAGANWGSSALPRIGQEVLIDFLEGNIDRPVVLGTVYNGRGQANAQHNQVAAGAGVATGNAPAWFPGDAGGHAHPAALLGIKTQAMQASQGGSGAYNQLVFDDSPGEARVALQRHAMPHQGTAELNLGHLRHQSDNQRLNTAGFGAELKTEHNVAIRAGKGLLLSSDTRGSATGSQMDAKEAITQLEDSLQMQTDLDEMAQKHTTLKISVAQGATQTGPLSAIAQIRHSVEVLSATESEVAAYSKPHLQLSAPKGIAATTPADAIFYAGATSNLSAGHDLNFAAQGNSYAIVKDGIKLFPYGKATSAQKPNQEIGIRLHAASGQVSMQSQADKTRLTADKALSVVSTTKSINIAAREHILLASQGASIRIVGGDIEVFGPGKIEFKATMKELAGPSSSTSKFPQFQFDELAPNQLELEHLYHDGEALSGAPYEAVFADGTVMKGVLDGNGRASLKNVPAGTAEVRYGPMPGKFARKDLTTTPNHKPQPLSSHIDALIDKYVDNGDQ
jgi:type VI secretion system secreted protein VgrG